MKIRELLTDESKWTKGTYGRDRQGNPVPYYSQKATAFCLSAAIFRCYPQQNKGTKLYRKIQKILGIGRKSIPGWNDDPARTFAEVKALVEELDV